MQEKRYPLCHLGLLTILQLYVIVSTGNTITKRELQRTGPITKWVRYYSNVCLMDRENHESPEPGLVLKPGPP
jgi:hypothetical protein